MSEPTPEYKVENPSDTNKKDNRESNMGKGDEELKMGDISLLARSAARLLDSAEPEDLENMTDITVVCSQALRRIAEISESIKTIR